MHVCVVFSFSFHHVFNSFPSCVFVWFPQTETFMHEATSFFLMENLPRFICGEELLNRVDVNAGY